MADLNNWVSIVSVLFISVTLLAIAYVRYCYGYWQRRKVPYLEPNFPFGNGTTLFPKGISIGAITKDFYEEFKRMGHKIGGVYLGIDPKLVVLDPDVIKDILVKDFQSFTDRGVYQSESDPISINIFSQPGQEWKNARLKFTSAFTSAKMKMMFQTMLGCTEGLKGALEKLAEQKADVDMLEVAGCYTTDVIGSCAFGIECNSFKHPDAEFRKFGRKVFNEFSFMDRLNLFLSIYAPNLARKLGVRNIQKDVSRFFSRTIRDTVEVRERDDLKRNDLLQLLIDLKNDPSTQLSLQEVVAQTFLFFLAGFETSSNITCLTLFEVSRDDAAQSRLRDEMKRVLEKYEGRITYDAIAEMKYLGQVVDETLRVWPPVATITRVCTKTYGIHGTDVTLEKGTSVLIPAMALHSDEQYWPDPTRWDPDRFSEENKRNIHPFTYLPFGEGPRNCIGLRFGVLQTKIALITVLSEYRVSLSPKTVLPLGIDMETFVLNNINKVYLRLEKI